MTDFVDRIVALALGTAPLAHPPGGPSFGSLDGAPEMSSARAPEMSSARADAGEGEAIHMSIDDLRWPADAGTPADAATSIATASERANPVSSGPSSLHAHRPAVAARAPEARVPGTASSERVSARSLPGMVESFTSDERPAQTQASATLHQAPPKSPARTTAPQPTPREAVPGAGAPEPFSLTHRRGLSEVEASALRRRGRSPAHPGSRVANIDQNTPDAPRPRERDNAVPGSRATTIDQRRRDASEAARPIRVSIGRIEVHAPTPAPPPVVARPLAAPPRTATSLDDYLARRGGRR